MRIALLSACSATALTLSAVTASAQVAPRDYWDIYADFLGTTGLSVSATETETADSLTLTDITLGLTLPQGFGEVAVIARGDTTLVSDGAGGVLMTYPDPMTVALAGRIGPPGQPEEAVTLDIAMAVSQSGAVTITGTRDDLTLTAESTAIDVTLTELSITGPEPLLEAITTDTVSIDYSIDSGAGVTRFTRADGLIRMEAQSQTGPSRYTLALDLPFAEVVVDQTGGNDGSAGILTVALPEAGVNWLNLAELLRAGMALTSVSQAFGAGSESVSATPDMAPTSQTSRTETTGTSFALSEDGLSVDWQAQGVTTSYEIQELLPFPVDIALAGASTTLVLPLLARDTAQPARYALSLDSLEIDDQVVRLLDPAGQLPREPIDLAIDIGAQLLVTQDLPDVMTVGPMIDMGETPVMPQAVSIDALDMSAAGVSLSGSGAFTLDFADMTTIPGMPRPTGQANARVTGLNALIDTLVSMGLLAPQDVMGARMGIGMVTNSVGDDTLESSVEVTEAGEVFVNGNRMR